MDLAETRNFDGIVPLPIPFQELKAYCDLYWRALHPWEIEILRAVDRKARNVIYAAYKKKADAK